MALLAEDPGPWWLATTVYAFAVAVLAAPMAVLGVALGSMGG